MARIKMRVCKDTDRVCSICKAKRSTVLDMYEIALGDIRLVLCDKCNSEILDKVLAAQVRTNSRTKDQHDMGVIRSRYNGTYVKGGVDADGTTKHPPTGYSVRYNAE